jgi:mevalonate kinase
LGSSAAFCVAFTRALNEKFDLNMESYHINEAAYAGECSFHGTPSGIDNTICCYEGMILFWKEMHTMISKGNGIKAGFTDKPLSEQYSNTELKFKEIETQNKIKLIIVDTGKKHETQKMVERVREFKEKNEDKFKEYIAEINHLVDDAKDAIIAGNMALLGELMLINHSLLENIGVSTKDIKRILSVGIENGALGGKLTGAGGGGSVILVYDNEDAQIKIMAAIKALGFHCFSVEI